MEIQFCRETEYISSKLEDLPIHIAHRILAFNGLRDIIAVTPTAKYILSIVEGYCEHEIKLLDYPWLQGCYSSFSFRRILHSLVFPRLIMVGGYEEPRRCDFFLPSSHRFLRASSLNMKRSQDYDVVYHQGRVYVLSGSSDNAFSASVELFDPIRREWQQLYSLPKKIIAAAGASFNGRLYCIGGYEFNHFQRISSIYILSEDHHLERDSGKYAELPVADIDLQALEVSSERWKMCARLLHERSSHAAAVYNGAIWIAGGIETEILNNSKQDAMSKSVEIFDPATMTIRRGPDMNRCRYQFKLLVVNGALWAVGGDIRVNGFLRGSLERYCGETDSWVFVTNLKTDRRRCSTCAYGSKIFCFGGNKGGGLGNRDDWDAYDVVTGKWLSDTDTEADSAGDNQNNNDDSSAPGTAKAETTSASDTVAIVLTSSSSSRSGDAVSSAANPSTGTGTDNGSISTSGGGGRGINTTATTAAPPGTVDSSRCELNRPKGLTFTVTVAMGSTKGRYY